MSEAPKSMMQTIVDYYYRDDAGGAFAQLPLYRGGM